MKKIGIVGLGGIFQKAYLPYIYKRYRELSGIYLPATNQFSLRSRLVCLTAKPTQRFKSWLTLI